MGKVDWLDEVDGSGPHGLAGKVDWME